MHQLHRRVAIQALVACSPGFGSLLGGSRSHSPQIWQWLRASSSQDSPEEDLGRATTTSSCLTPQMNTQSCFLDKAQTPSVMYTLCTLLPASKCPSKLAGPTGPPHFGPAQERDHEPTEALEQEPARGSCSVCGQSLLQSSTGIRGCRGRESGPGLLDSSVSCSPFSSWDTSCLLVNELEPLFRTVNTCGFPTSWLWVLP